MSKRIAIFTTFHAIDTQYSVCVSTLELCKALVKNGHYVRLLVLTNFPDQELDWIPEGVEVRRCIPVFKWVDYNKAIMPKHPTFDKELQETTQALITNLTDDIGKPDIRTVITQDIIFQGWFVLQNAAMREVAQACPELRWIHWIHSSPSKRPKKMTYPTNLKYKGMGRSWYISMNYMNIPALAEMYKIPEGMVRVVYNIRDPREFFEMHPISRQAIETGTLLDADIVMVYPTRMTSAKQPFPLAKIAGSLQQIGQDVRLVFCNSYSNNEASKDLINKTKTVGTKWGLPEENMVFTSELGYELGVPVQVVRDLMLISNVFVLPSRNEGCSLTMLEAALTKNLVILNEDLRSMHEFGGDDVYYVSFGSDYRPLTGFKGGTEKDFFRERAQVIVEMLQQGKTLSFHRKILKRFNMDWIYKNQIAPLL
jgi:hypothetical protein